MPDTGSGYGGKHTGEAAIEAARLAKAAGKPVKLVWTREEEFTWAYFRPAGVIEVQRRRRRKDGTLTAWEFHNYNSGALGPRARPTRCRNQRIEFHPTRLAAAPGLVPGLAATANHFARETPHGRAGPRRWRLDPLAFRLKNLKDAAAARGPRGRGRALRLGQGASPAAAAASASPCGTEKGGYVATCAEVAVGRPSGQVQVVRLVTAFECGAIVNPDHLKNQVEGAVIMGLGGALFEAIEFDDGRILNPASRATACRASPTSPARDGAARPRTCPRPAPARRRSSPSPRRWPTPSAATQRRYRALPLRATATRG